MSGAVIAALGLGLGSITRSLAGLMITYSIVTGVGFGLMYIPSIVAVANHFTRQRSLAIGLCLCGAGVGTFALSPLETEITENYGWRSEMTNRHGHSYNHQRYLGGVFSPCVFSASVVAFVELR